MKLFLGFIEGPWKGRKVSLVGGKTSIGRNHGDIKISEDRNLSRTHAFFQKESKTWWVVDNQSKQGVFVNGIREVKARIKNEDVIQMGSNKIRCQLLAAESSRFSEQFLVWLPSLAKKMKNVKKQKLQEIRPEIQLEVIHGVQYGKSWDIFYGPREIGRDSSDICLHDENAPEKAFQILSKDKYPYFSTTMEALVRVNGKSFKDKQLQPGDIISLGNSQILVKKPDSCEVE